VLWEGRPSSGVVLRGLGEGTESAYFFDSPTKDVTAQFRLCGVWGAVVLQLVERRHCRALAGHFDAI
jgi:hypothetical protein